MPSHSNTRRHQWRSAFANRPGFNMVEMIITIVLVMILAGIAIPNTVRIIRHERVNRAAQVVTQDLQNGFALAGRMRAPVRLTFYPSTKNYVFTDRATGAVLQSRFLSTGTDYSVTSLATTATTVDILPNGIGSTSFIVTLTHGDYSRRVSATSAGFVRMSPQ